MIESDAAIQIGEVAGRHIAAWNEPDDRRRAVTELWTEDGKYTGPLAAVEGHDAMEAVISGAREQFLGLRRGRPRGRKPAP